MNIKELKAVIADLPDSMRVAIFIRRNGGDGHPYSVLVESSFAEVTTKGVYSRSDEFGDDEIVLLID